MKKLILSVAVLGAFSTAVHAQTAPTPEHTFTGNLTVASDYRFRGISQTFKKPTVQGGFDYAHASGFYVGNWNSNVSGNQYNNGAGLEMDFYGGYKFAPAPDLGLDIGLLYYYYPGARVGQTGEKYNNGEIYFGGTYKWFSAKYSYGLTDFFGLNDTTAATPRGNSKGSGYLDLAVNFEVAEKTTLTLHAGRQWVRHYGEFNYNDYKIGIARDFGFATVGLAVIGTDADKGLYTAVDGSGRSKKVGETTAVLSISKTF
nr:TorF family putative porin [uncultured Noviherbaspirillum sp.]